MPLEANVDNGHDEEDDDDDHKGVDNDVDDDDDKGPHCLWVLAYFAHRTRVKDENTFRNWSWLIWWTWIAVGVVIVVLAGKDSSNIVNTYWHCYWNFINAVICLYFQ